MEMETKYAAEQIFQHFLIEAGIADLPFIDQVQDIGDIVRQDAPSQVIRCGESMSVVRVRDQYEVTRLQIDFLIQDAEASLSMADLQRLYVVPAAIALKEEIGDRVLVNQPDILAHEGLTWLLYRGVRMTLQYDYLKRGTEITLSVLVLEPCQQESKNKTTNSESSNLTEAL